MTADPIPALKQLWQEAFGDPMPMIDAFFATGFSMDRCHFLLQDGKPVSALYWFDCQCNDEKLAYLYAVATQTCHRGKGLGTRLMEETHQILRDKGYAGCILVPGCDALRNWYSPLGYRAATTVTEFTCQAGAAVPLREISAAEYAALRTQYLPAGSVMQADSALDFFQTQGHFYTGRDWLLAASAENGMLIAQEFLGDHCNAPGVLRALDCTQGRFRTPGADKPFAMYLPLTQDAPLPTYFGFALD